MKKLTLLVMSLVFGFAAMAQVPTELPDDFEAYTAWMQLADQNPDLWTTWSDNPGSAEDPFVSSDAANSGANSVVIEAGNDLVLPLGDLTSGNYNFTFKVMVPTGFTGYYNVLHMFDGGSSEWGTQVYFGANGQGSIDGGAEGAATFTYAYDTWITVDNKINLTFDEATVAIDGVDYVTWQWSMGTFGEPGLNQIGAANFYAWDEEGTPKMYIDDVDFIDLGIPGVGEPPVNLAGTVVDDFYVQLTWDAPGAAQSELLWDQIDPLDETYGKSAQDFEDAGNDAYDAEVCGDFVLTEAATVNKIATRFFYNANGAGNVDPRVFNVAIFADESGVPAETPLYTTTTVECTPDENNVFAGDLVDPIALEAGTYWVGYSMQLAYGANEIQCYANQRAATDNETPGYWRNPGDGFGTGFTTWTQDIASQGGDLEDVCFAIYGAPATAQDLANMNDYNNVVVEKNYQVVDLAVTTSAKTTNVAPANLKSRELLGYNVYRDGTVIANEISDLTYYDGALDPGSYTYLVTAVYPEGESAPAGPLVMVISAGIPQAVITPNNVLAQSVDYGQTGEKNLNIANTGTADLMFEIYADYTSDAKTYVAAPHVFKAAPAGTGELVSATNNSKPANYAGSESREMLWDNAGGIAVSTSGLISGGYGGVGAEDNLVNCADDFIVPTGEQWSIEFIHTEGFTTEEAPVDPDGFGVVIYSDAFGAPAEVIYEEIVPWNTYEAQDLALALPPSLTAGHYWLSVYAWFETGTEVANHRWNWYYGTTGIGHEAVLQDEPGFFGGMDWTVIGPDGLGTDGRSMFFIMEGTKTVTNNWLSFEPQAGTVAMEANTDVTVTFDPNEIVDPQNTTYQGTIKVYTNDPALPMEDITAALQLTSVGIGEEESTYIAVYPNPAVDVMNVVANENIKAVRVMNLAGQVVFSSAVNAERYTVNASDLESGIYFVQIEAESGISTRKISVQ